MNSCQISPPVLWHKTLNFVVQCHFELKFINLAAGGDAIGDMGKPLVTAQDALELSTQHSGNGATQSTDKPFSINVVKKPNPQMCEIQSRRGDVMGIQYIASYTIDDDKKFVYDSSAQRGTGLPYQFELGSGDSVVNARIQLRSLPHPFSYIAGSSMTSSHPSHMIHFPRRLL